MSINEALETVALLGIETAPFIYFVEKHPDYVAKMRSIFQRVDEAQLQVITSTITLTEVLTLPFETGNVSYQRAYREMLLNTASITTLPVTASIAEKAAELRARHRLRTPDALHIATALVSGCDAFLTNDLKLKRVTEIQVLVLGEL